MVKRKRSVREIRERERILRVVGITAVPHSIGRGPRVALFTLRGAQTRS